MKLKELKIKNHPILKDLCLNFVKPKSNDIYNIICFVGENGCGKTTLLNELLNYNNSKYIVDKQPYSVGLIANYEYHSLFVRQNTIYSLSQNELSKVIDGKSVPFPINFNDDLVGGKNVFGLRTKNMINTPNLGKEEIEKFGDAFIYDCYMKNKISDITCGGYALKLINGEIPEIDLTQLSSGQQEILLKLKILEQQNIATDWILFDEPETCLHPRWQKIIIDLFQKMIKPQYGEEPQIFIATHSEKILESLLQKDDVCIVRFTKENDAIKANRIEDIGLKLPTIAFSELDYVIFNIPSYDYHNELYGYLIDKKRLNTKNFDNYIKDSKIYKENKDELYKLWIHTYKKDTQLIKETYETLPSYIRNYFHHPKDRDIPSEIELVRSIELLRNLIDLEKNS